jgi:hypothetical protein
MVLSAVMARGTVSPVPSGPNSVPGQSSRPLAFHSGNPVVLARDRDDCRLVNDLPMSYPAERSSAWALDTRRCQCSLERR